jgi:hypothetical protein
MMRIEKKGGWGGGERERGGGGRGVVCGGVLRHVHMYWTRTHALDTYTCSGHVHVHKHETYYSTDLLSSYTYCKHHSSILSSVHVF